MLLPASAARTWISRNVRNSPGRPRAADASEASSCGQVEIRLFACVEVIDGGPYLELIQPQVGHDTARGGDLAFRDPAVGLCYVAHRAECGPEELFADRERIRIVAQARLGARVARILVELVTQEYAHGRTHGASREQPERGPDDFSGELHALL